MGFKELRQRAQIHPRVSFKPRFSSLRPLLLAVERLAPSPLKSFCSFIAHLSSENVMTHSIQGECVVTNQVKIKVCCYEKCASTPNHRKQLSLWIGVEEAFTIQYLNVLYITIDTNILHT